MKFTCALALLLAIQTSTATPARSDENTAQTVRELKAQIDLLQRQVNQLQTENARLREENKRLKATTANAPAPAKPAGPPRPEQLEPKTVVTVQQGRSSAKMPVMFPNELAVGQEGSVQSVTVREVLSGDTAVVEAFWWGDKPTTWRARRDVILRGWDFREAADGTKINWSHLLRVAGTQRIGRTTYFVLETVRKANPPAAAKPQRQ